MLEGIGKASQKRTFPITPHPVECKPIPTVTLHGPTIHSELPGDFIQSHGNTSRLTRPHRDVGTQGLHEGPEITNKRTADHGRIMITWVRAKSGDAKDHVFQWIELLRLNVPHETFSVIHLSTFRLVGGESQVVVQRRDHTG